MTNATHALIIDDNAVNLEVIARLLNMEGISCTKIQNAGEIQSTIDSPFKTDLVFLDLEMPQMDGYEAFHLLRNTLGTDIPIVACTVHINEVATVRELGFHSFIAKPLDAERFPGQVKQILDGQPVWEF
jgi:CheY-like chemotaxis protein